MREMTIGRPPVATMKMTQTMLRIMICPAIMLAKSRMVSETGFIRAEKTSMTGMIGLRKTGTSGLKISL